MEEKKWEKILVLLKKINLKKLIHLNYISQFDYFKVLQNCPNLESFSFYVKTEIS